MDIEEQLRSLQEENSRLLERIRELEETNNRHKDRKRRQDEGLGELANQLGVLLWSGKGDAIEGFALDSAYGFESVLGYQPDEFSWKHLLFVDDEDQLNTYARLAMGETIAREYQVVHADGSPRWVHAKIRAVLDEESNIARYDGIFFDATKEKHVEQELVQAKDQLQQIFDALDVALFSYDAMSGQVFISSGIEKLIGERKGPFIAWEELMSYIYPEDYPSVMVAWDRLQTSSVYLKEYRVIRADGKLSWISARMVPVYEDGKIKQVRGVLINIDDRKAIESKLIVSEQRYKSLFEYNPDLVVEMDLEGRIVGANSATEKIAGYRPEEIIDKHYDQYIVPIDHVRVAEQLGQVLQQGVTRYFETTILHKNGNSVLCEVTNVPIIVDGVIVGAFGICTDITHKRQLEIAIKEKKARYRMLVEQCPVPIGMHSQGEVTYLNHAGLQIIGAERIGQIAGRNVLDFVVGTKEIGLKEICMSGAASSLSLRIKTLTGEILDIEAGELRLKDDEESSMFYFMDVTMKKRVDAVIRESEEHFRKLAESSPLPIVLHQEGVLLYINQAGVELLGLSRVDDVLGSNIYDYLDPEYINVVTEAKERLMRDGKIQPTRIRIIPPNGQKIDVEVVSSYDPKTLTTQMTLNNITARIKAEEALAESELRYRRLVEMSPETILVHQEGRVVYCNPAGLKLLGASSMQGLLGTEVLHFVHEQYRESIEARQERIFDGAQVGLIEAKIITQNRQEIDIESIGCEISYTGRPAILVSMRDITERKKTERLREETQHLLRDSEKRYIQLQESLDRFSKDVFGVVEVKEMERRLVQEVCSMLEMPIGHVSVVECTQDGRIVPRAGSKQVSPLLKEAILSCSQPALTGNTIFREQAGWFVRIGERHGNNVFLCIDQPVESLNVHPIRVWLHTLTRYVNVLYDNFRVIEDLSRGIERMAGEPTAPPWLLRMLFTLSENERKRLAQDLHDEALQEQIVQYRKLESIITESEFPENLLQELLGVKEGLLDVMYQIRLTCNELRPPLLKELGLVAALNGLLKTVQLRNDYVIAFDSDYRKEHGDDISLSIYRIVQELLSNASKHSNASEVCLTLLDEGTRVFLGYSDNGVGLELEHLKETYGTMGVSGIRERVRSMNGTVEFYSTPNQGLKIDISIPINN